MRQCPLIVLKFGSSVLRTEDDLPLVVHEIYRWVRDGYRVLAVVSAFESRTNQLFAQAQRFTDRPDAASVAALVATGEAASAALLSLVLDRAGLASALLDADRVSLRTQGPLLDADPCAVNCDAIDRFFKHHSVAVLPGFVGRDQSGSSSLLGRGGSDLTALFLAQQLGAERCRLVKDVDGLFDRDPAHTGASAKRYETLSWQDALALDADIVQHKSLVFADEHQLEFEVASPGSQEGTLIGSGTTTFYADAPIATPPLKIGLLGLGTVGLGVYRALAAQPHLFEVTGISVRTTRERDADVPVHLLTTDAWEVIDSDCSVVVELIGGTEPAMAYITGSLARGKYVVTANKQVIANCGAQLHELAENSGLRLLYSAAVGGSVPMLETVKRLAEEGPIISLRGVLNGTTTFVLDKLAKGASFDEALASAQACGFAEADATLDLNGTDAAHKLVLLAGAASGIAIDLGDINQTGIQDISADYVRNATENGGVVRLVASIDFVGEKFSARVAPSVIPTNEGDPLARTAGEQCCLIIQRQGAPDFVAHGKGAGRWPTTESVMADLFSLRREPATVTPHTIPEDFSFAGVAQ